ncbi:unnamed protein product [Vitrella brassicaformis CCMP3155]|uniref:Transcription elongation factor SPT5 n=2 Tax=Vitrella brassicaformis TaxID=1169539 RepID=A0A0G4ER82_VITBC|nr:unnamed protein product [Vitrella brassicaformis CCMP3155]|eukprot:CEL99962.1 unnamed protein product [Vitrella brassicaformis CCMP3155]
MESPEEEPHDNDEGIFDDNDDEHEEGMEGGSPASGEPGGAHEPHPQHQQPGAAAAHAGGGSGGGYEGLERDEDEDAEHDYDEEDEDEDDEEEEDESPQEQRRKKSKKKRGRGTGPARKNAKKRKRGGAQQFLDIEAAEDEDEDEDEEDDDLFNEVADEAELNRAASNRELADRRRRDRDDAERGRRQDHLSRAIEGMEERFKHIGEVGDEEDMMEDYEERYGPGAGVADARSLMPDFNRDKLWLVKCRETNKEREVCIAIMRKFFAKLNETKDAAHFGITAAYAADNLKGYIYVEAENDGRIREALYGFRSLNITKIMRVPTNEMQQVFKMRGKLMDDFQKSDWVRFKRGLYGGDLAQVYQYDDLSGQVWVLVKPRIDWHEVSELSQKEEDNGGRPYRIPAGIKTGQKRPPPKFFESEEVQSKYNLIVETHNEAGLNLRVHKVFNKKFYGGLLLEKVRAGQLVSGADVRPSLDEQRNFHPKDAGEELHDLQRLRDKHVSAKPLDKASDIVIGDRVVAYKGQLKGIRGHVVDVVHEGAQVVVESEVANQDNKLKYTLDRGEVRRIFVIGDHVHAIQGVNEGESGLIVEVEDDKIASVFSQTNKKAWKSDFANLRLVSDEGVGGLDRLGAYAVGHLVLLTNQETGVITRIERNKTLHVLLSNGKIQPVQLSEISQRRKTSFSRSSDKNRVQFGANDYVTVLDGEHTGITGIVEHIWRSQVFIKVKGRVDNGGYVVVSSRNLKKIGGDRFAAPTAGGRPSAVNGPPNLGPSSATEAGPGSFAYEPASAGGVIGPTSPVLDSQYGGGPSATARSGRGGRGGSRVTTLDDVMGRGRDGRGGFRSGGFRGGGGRGRGRQHDFIGQDARILKGHYKGYTGTIRDVERNNITITLHSKSRSVTLPGRDVTLLNNPDEKTGYGAEAFRAPSRAPLSSQPPLSHPPSARLPSSRNVQSPSYPFSPPSIRDPPRAANQPVSPPYSAMGRGAGEQRDPYEPEGSMPMSPAFPQPSAGGGGTPADNRAMGMQSPMPTSPQLRHNAAAFPQTDVHVPRGMVSPPHDQGLAGAMNEGRGGPAAAAAGPGGGGGGLSAESDEGRWAMRGVQVVISAEGDYNGQCGIIKLRKTDEGICHVHIPGEGDEDDDLIAIELKGLKPLDPQENQQQVIVVGGREKFGEVGTVLTIAPTHTAVALKMRGSGELQTVEKKHLAVYQSPPASDEEDDEEEEEEEEEDDQEQDEGGE